MDISFTSKQFKKSAPFSTALFIKSSSSFSASFADSQRISILSATGYSSSSKNIEEAIAILQHQDVVIGPALDGGYYLLGFSSYLPCIFEGIDWGTPKVYRQTIVLLEEHLIQWAQLVPKSDLDTFENLKELWKDLKSPSYLRKNLDRELTKVLGQIMSKSSSDSY